MDLNKQIGTYQESIETFQESIEPYQTSTEPYHGSIEPYHKSIEPYQESITTNQTSFETNQAYVGADCELPHNPDSTAFTFETRGRSRSHNVESCEPEHSNHPYTTELIQQTIPNESPESIQRTLPNGTTNPSYHHDDDDDDDDDEDMRFWAALQAKQI